MSRQLRGLDAGPGRAAAWAAALPAAVAGDGPALTPLPNGPEAVREALLAAFRPDDPQAPLESDEVALVVPTSGSTGEPKGALLTGAALLASARATHARLGGAGHWVLALPLTHIAGLMVVVRAAELGGMPVEVDTSQGFTPAAFAAATVAAVRTGAGSPLYTALVPTQLGRLLDAEADLRAYDAILLGAAAAPARLLQRAAALGVRVVTTYGMSETCGGCVYDGIPLEGATVELDGDGRVLLSGAMLFSGYRLRPDLTRAAVDDAGRLKTSDLGSVDAGADADGATGRRLHILGRVDDVLISGGENVAPATVERAVATLASVSACVVVGVPDPDWGEAVVAVVVPAPAGPAPHLDGMRAALAAVLPPAALPRRLVLTGEIPLLPTGKPDRRAVRDLVARDFGDGPATAGGRRRPEEP